MGRRQMALGWGRAGGRRRQRSRCLDMEPLCEHQNLSLIRSVDRLTAPRQPVLAGERGSELQSLASWCCSTWAHAFIG